MTQTLSVQALDRLRALPGLTLREGAAREAYRLHGQVPAAAALAASAEAVGQALFHAAALGLAVVPWGAGRHQSLGRAPARYDLALDLTRLNRVLAYEPADMTVTVEAGIRLSDLERHLAQAGQFLPLDPPGGDGATLGGVLAANLSGPLRCRYGTARDLLLGLRVAGVSGCVTFSGSRVVKNATAYDLSKLHVGALGTLGVLVEATLRVYPRPAAEASWWIVTDGIERTQALASRILASSLTPTRLELLDAEGAAVVGVEGSGLLLSVAGVAEAVADQEVRLRALAAEGGGRLTPVADTRAAWMAVRDFPWPAAPGGGDALRWRGGLPPAACGRAMAAIRDRLPTGLSARLQASAASGTLRGMVSGEASSLLRTVAELRALLEGMGGYLVVLDAPAHLRGALDIWGAPQDGLDVMRRLRQAHDPLETLNPGRFLPEL